MTENSQDRIDPHSESQLSSNPAVRKVAGTAVDLFGDLYQVIDQHLRAQVGQIAGLTASGVLTIERDLLSRVGSLPFASFPAVERPRCTGSVPARSVTEPAGGAISDQVFARRMLLFLNGGH